VKVALAASALAACDPAPMTIDQYKCPPGGTTLTYANFGAQFFANNCNTCHSAPDGDARHGAPDDVHFDTLDDVLAHKPQIFVDAAGPNTSMPPGPDDPPLDQRDDLEEWLGCGAAP